MNHYESALQTLERWVVETDGYLIIAHTFSGGWTLGCGREVGIPSDFLPPCPHESEYVADDFHKREAYLALSQSCDCPSSGWVVEFIANGVREGSDFPGEHFSRFHEHRLTLDAAFSAVLAAILSGKKCECVVPSKLTLNYEWERRIEQLDEDIVRVRKGEKPITAPQEGFNDLVDAVLAAVEESKPAKRFVRGSMALSERADGDSST
jgi:hypothetical protein